MMMDDDDGGGVTPSILNTRIGVAKRALRPLGDACALSNPNSRI